MTPRVPPIRVFQVATGNVGAEMIGRIAAHRDLELVGLHCYTPEKIGQDAGVLAGLDPVGVFATGTVEEILAARPDVVTFHGVWPDLEIYQAFDFGTLARFYLLDTRQYRDDQPCGDADTDFDDLPPWHRAHLGPLVERFALDQFHHQKGDALFLAVDVGPDISEPVYGRDVGVIQRSQKLRLAFEPRQTLRIGGQFRRQTLMATCRFRRVSSAR